MNKLIIVHPGTAHFDDFFAVSLILAVDSDATYKIERRSPTEAELANPGIWVVDIGGRLEPELKNFDHHQSTDIPASFILVADYLGLTDTLKILPWWEYKDTVDRFGAGKIADELGIDSFFPYFSPVEDWLLDLFKQDPNKISDLLCSFGQNVIETARILDSQFKFWESCETRVIKNKTVLIGLTDNSSGSQQYGKQMDPPADISITYDSRGPGWKLCRLNDAKGVDFSKLDGHKDLLFVHKTGFIAKTKKRLPLSNILKMIETAIEA
ncbi:MAG: MYG1 family protein [Desulfobacterales bacterium]|nr:MYG1 family protein [Desulfobacterales bacterium]